MTRANEFARTMRKEMTDAERRLWKHLRLRNIDLFRFRRQYPVARYIVDFICLEARLVIEVDGGQHADKVEYDAERTAFLESAGYKVIRFWNSEITQNIDGVLQVISDALHEIGPPS